MGGATLGDGRSRWVRLTRQGRELAAKVLDASGRVQRELVSGVSPEAVRGATDALREVLAVLGCRR